MDKSNVSSTQSQYSRHQIQGVRRNNRDTVRQRQAGSTVYGIDHRLNANLDFSAITAKELEQAINEISSEGDESFPVHKETIKGITYVTLYLHARILATSHLPKSLRPYVRWQGE